MSDTSDLAARIDGVITATKDKMKSAQQDLLQDYLDRQMWLAAVRAAPTVKDNFYTVLSSRDVLPEVERLLAEDPRLARCFRQRPEGTP